MADYIEVGKVSDFASGQIKQVNASGKAVLLARVGDKFYASENFCPHMGADLSQGKLDGTIVTCPRHHSQFDLIDGHVIRWTDWTGIKLSLAKLARPPRALKVYEVKIDGDKVMVSTENVAAAVA